VAVADKPQYGTLVQIIIAIFAVFCFCTSLYMLTLRHACSKAVSAE
jgi:hypothetical protein